MSTSRRSKPSSSCSDATTSRARSQRWQPAAWYRVTCGSGIDTAGDRRLGDALDGEAVRRHAHGQVTPLRRLPRLLERAAHDVVELRVHLHFLPEVLLEALHPFEVRDDDAARVRKYVGEDEHALVLEDGVAGRRDRAVRPLAHD